METLLWLWMLGTDHRTVLPPMSQLPWASSGPLLDGPQWVSLRGGLVSIQLQVKAIHCRHTHMERFCYKPRLLWASLGHHTPTPTAGTLRPQPENVRGPGKEARAEKEAAWPGIPL